jgi:hypothetical protein
MTSPEERCARVDARLAEQLQRSIEINARMVTRLQRHARKIFDEGCDSQVVAQAMVDISHDKDPS